MLRYYRYLRPEVIGRVREPCDIENYGCIVWTWTSLQHQHYPVDRWNRLVKKCISLRWTFRLCTTLHRSRMCRLQRWNRARVERKHAIDWTKRNASKTGNFGTLQFTVRSLKFLFVGIIIFSRVSFKRAQVQSTAKWRQFFVRTKCVVAPYERRFRKRSERRTLAHSIET